MSMAKGRPTSDAESELWRAGKRAVSGTGCQSILVAPDHTGADNYHNCSGGPHQVGDHFCGCGYQWHYREGRTITVDPFAKKEDSE